MKMFELKEITGSLSKPSKMPGFAYGLPAKECKTGSKLRKVKGSTCEKCYAMKNCYAFKTTQAAQYKRLDSLKNKDWVMSMAIQIGNKKEKFFRWHDSGDVQNLKHLAKIFEVAKRTPDIKHWLPTREAWVLKYQDRAPENLVIRFSMAMVNQEAAGSWHNTSTVVTDSTVDNCAAFRTDKTGKVHSLSVYKKLTKLAKKELDFGHCGNCRKCWDKTIDNVAYLAH